jgi:hypothetical protein
MDMEPSKRCSPSIMERAVDGFVLTTYVRCVALVRRFECAMVRHLARSGPLAGLLVMMAGDALPAITCKPILLVRNVQEVRGPTASQPWSWTATIVADASYCSTRSGTFEIDFIRIKEYAPDVQFTEVYKWSPGRFRVAVELAADEAILAYRIGFVAPCVCQALPFEK